MQLTWSTCSFGKHFSPIPLTSFIFGFVVLPAEKGRQKKSAHISTTQRAVDYNCDGYVPENGSPFFLSYRMRLPFIPLVSINFKLIDKW